MDLVAALAHSDNMLVNGSQVPLEEQPIGLPKV